MTTYVHIRAIVPLESLGLPPTRGLMHAGGGACTTLWHQADEPDALSQLRQALEDKGLAFQEHAAKPAALMDAPAFMSRAFSGAPCPLCVAEDVSATVDPTPTT